MDAVRCSQIFRSAFSQRKWQINCGEKGTEEFDSRRLLRIIGYSQCLEVYEFRNIVGKFLSGADLNGAYLSGANLSGADLICINLSDAYLSDAYLSDAYLSGANLSEVKWNSGTQWANVIGLHKAHNVPEELAQQPKFASAVVLSRGYSLMEKRDVDAALAAYQEAQTLDADLEISANFWNHLCWEGCLHHRAADVLFAGENAVRFEPDNGEHLDTRGLARSLTGDIAGAIEDFQRALDLGTFDDSDTEQQQRQGWLDALRRGENPFTPEVLEKLRKG